MKNIIAAIFVCLLSAVSYGASAQAQVEFAETSHKFGEIVEGGGTVSHVFTFTNTGDAPLLITAIQVNCSCTKTTYTRQPVPAGGKGEVKVTYDPKRQSGTFNKTINVYTNATEPRSIITVSGSIKQ